MEQQHARHLLSFVNDPKNIEDIKYYVALRIAALHKELESADLSLVTNIQGRIYELRKLDTIQDYIRSKAE